mmetsp:Transcript_15460/g.13498  ORF Transcript_15460/g.13498 Transcript_15460/m.13498 type:complete len:178 (-) Transcript_15460:43-576(-)
MASFSDKRYNPVQQKYALILQNRNIDINAKTPFLNFNESNINLTHAPDANLIELYTQAKRVAEAGKVLKKGSKAVKTTRNHQLVDKLTKRGKGRNTFEHNQTYDKKKSSRKPKLETLPHDLSAAIHSGQRMVNNLFTSNTTPTSNAKNSLKTTMSNSINPGVFKVNKSFWNKLKKPK